MLPNSGRIRKVGGPPEGSRRYGQGGETFVKEVSTKAHVRNQAAARRNPVLAAEGPARDQENTGAMKLVVELKPDVFSQDATAGELRIWVKNSRLITMHLICR